MKTEDIHVLRIKQISDYIASEKRYFWDAFDQGRYAFHLPKDQQHNSHCEWHVNHRDWQRGFAQERTYCSETYPEAF